MFRSGFCFGIFSQRSFNRANGEAEVLGGDFGGGGGIEFLELGVDEFFAVFFGFLLEAGAEFGVWRDAFQFVAVDDRGNVEAGAADEHGDFAAGLDLGDFGSGEVVILSEG